MSAKTFKENAMETWVYTDPVDAPEETMLASATFGMDSPLRPPLPPFPIEACSIPSSAEPSDFLLGC